MKNYLLGFALVMMLTPMSVFASTEYNCQSATQAGIDWTISVKKVVNMNVWNVSGTQSLNGQATSIGFSFPSTLSNRPYGRLTIEGLRVHAGTNVPEVLLTIDTSLAEGINAHISADEKDSQLNTVGRLDTDLVCTANR